MNGPQPPRCSAADAIASALPASGRVARVVRLSGRVQGVGFRPFVYRLACEHGLAGGVQNLRGEVEIRVEGAAQAVERFVGELTSRAPELARPEVRSVRPVAVEGAHEFVILSSVAALDAHVYVPPDSFTCVDCLAELADTSNRRHRYPFINCTQCGPRYTLIEALPYDRDNTTMGEFPLCEACRREYESPVDRRFHAEPIACPECGPQVWAEAIDASMAVGEPTVVTSPGEAGLSKTAAVLLGGGIAAVKGVGGYHLFCDATQAQAVMRLRDHKRRPAKPLAVMFAQTGRDGLHSVRQEVELTELEARVLRSPARPIVLVRKRTDTALAAAVAPGLAEVGAILPYSPLHHLLLAAVGRPLVATSGNVSGEPVLTDWADARRHLAAIVDIGLHHDRPIARPADDSVVRCAGGRTRTLRIGRGLGPLELELPWRLERPVLATGGHLKTTIALAWDARVVISPHIGDMGTSRAVQVFAQVARDLQRLYGVQAAQVVCDAHPDYATTRWAEASRLPLHRVLHHHAHASAIAGEWDPLSPMLVFAWDGAGLGADGTLWGGESLLGLPGHWHRVASLRPFRLPGGEAAARAPWRCAAGLCWEVGAEPSAVKTDALVRRAWEQNLNCPRTSSVGRLFDAAAALIFGLRQTSYEAQAPMRLESAARGITLVQEPQALPLRRDATGLWRLDWAPLLPMLVDASRRPAQRAAIFHVALAVSIVRIAEEQRRSTGVDRVALVGGVFQNAWLTELARERLEARGFRVGVAERIPCNDGGLSYGQIIEWAGLRQRGARRVGE